MRGITNRQLLMLVATLVVIIGVTTIMKLDPEHDRSHSSTGPAGLMNENDLATSNQHEPSRNLPRILFLGDSLFAGYGLAAHQSAPALIQQKINHAGLHYVVINAGRAGDTSAQALQRLPHYFDRGIPIQVLVIGLGSNDIINGVSLDSLESNLKSIIQEARQNNPDMKVFLFQMRMFPPYVQDERLLNEYAGLFPKVAEESGAILLPFFLEDVAGRPELNQADGLHPTTRGTRIVANQMWESLQGRL